MDSYSYTNMSSSSSSSASSYYQYQQQDETRAGKTTPLYLSTLHSVRKRPMKNIITKKPIAPMPPIPPKIYKVSSVDFRDVVQKLTGLPEFQPTRLQEVAPPPLSLSPAHRQPFVNPSVMVVPISGYSAETQIQEKPHKSYENGSNTFGGLSPLGFGLSPSSLAWCCSILFSPGTLSPFQPSAVL